MDFHSSRLSWLQPLPSVQSASSRYQHWALNIPQAISQLSCDRLVTLDHLHHGRGSVLSLLEQTGDRSDFAACNISVKTTIDNGVTKCLTHCHGILHSTASEYETHLIAKEVWQWTHAHRIHWSYLKLVTWRDDGLAFLVVVESLVLPGEEGREIAPPTGSWCLNLPPALARSGSWAKVCPP